MSTQPSAPGKVPSGLSRPVGWLRDLPIWTKLGLIMIVPTIATIVVGTAGLLNQVEEANNAEVEQKKLAAPIFQYVFGAIK